jgi:hypothetical protein
LNLLVLRIEQGVPSLARQTFDSLPCLCDFERKANRFMPVFELCESQLESVNVGIGGGLSHILFGGLLIYGKEQVWM